MKCLNPEVTGRDHLNLRRTFPVDVWKGSGNCGRRCRYSLFLCDPRLTDHVSRTEKRNGPGFILRPQDLDWSGDWHETPQKTVVGSPLLVVRWMKDLLVPTSPLYFHPLSPLDWGLRCVLTEIDQRDGGVGGSQARSSIDTGGVLSFR